MEKPLKILLLEDSHTDAEIIRRLLIKEVSYCEVKLAMNKKSFLNALDEFTPDVILSDNALPRFNATEALKIVRNRYLHIPFILITGTVSEEYAANIIRQGADDYILKDRMTRLPAAIDSALRYRESEKEKLAAAAKLIQSEEKYRTIFFKSPLPKWIYDTGTLRFLDVNEAAILQYGYTEAEFLQMTIKDIRPKEDVKALLNDISRIRNGPDSRYGTWRHLKKNGEIIIVETTAHSIEYGTSKARIVVINDVTEKLKAEENYRVMMERVSDAFVAIDHNWIYTYVNARAGEIMGRNVHDLLGKNIWTEFPEGIGQPFYEAYHKALKEQEYIYLDAYYAPLERWLENHIYPSPEGLSIFFRDITERKRAEQKIIQSEENLKAIFDNSSEGFILLDEQGTIKTFNDRAGQKILRITKEAMKTGENIFDFVDDDRGESFREIFRAVLKGGTTQYDRAYLQDDHTTTWINFSFNPVRKDDLIKGICITARNITEKKIAEQQKEIDSNNLKALINNTTDLMWSVDRDLKVLTFNDAFNEVITFMSGKALVKGKDILSTQFTEDQRKRYKILYERALSGEAYTIVDHFVGASAEVWAEISFYPIRHEGQVIGTACFSRDITERKKAEAELRRLEQEKLESKIEEQKKITRAMLIAQEKERHAIGIELHDNVNQILAGTKLVLSMAVSDPENIRELITASINHLQEAIEENRKIAHVLVAPDLKKESLVVQLKKLAANMLEVSDIEVAINTGEFNEDVLDTERKFNIYRIAQEQCTNIVKYAKATTVHFKLATTAASFTMSVSDNGIGMDASKKATGIGIRNITDRAGLFNGTATIITAPGEGFTLEITIPV